MDIYKKLSQKLDSLPIGFPPTESGVELKILKHWFTPQMAEIALNLSSRPEPIHVIAERCNMTVEALEPILEKMAEQGNIVRYDINDEMKYLLIPFAEGMWEFHAHSHFDPSIAKEVEEYNPLFMEKAWFATPTTQRRVIPLNVKISTENQIMDYDSASKIILAQKKIGLAPCVCRKEAEQLGKGCHHEMNNCLMFGHIVDFFVDQGWGEAIDTKKALEILQNAREEGLVPQAGNTLENISGICFCCGCSCRILTVLKNMDSPGQIVHHNFFAVVNEEKCIQCGVCEEICPMDAISIDDVAKPSLIRCIGCGVCVHACSEDALQLNMKDTTQLQKPPKSHGLLFKTILKERAMP